MHYLEKFYNQTLKYELINKFKYSNIKNLPKIKKVILNFSCKTADIRQLASSLLAIELITSQQGKLTKTNYPQILFKIRKGNPTGCKVILRKFNMLNYMSKILIEIVPRIKNFNGFQLNKNSQKNTFSYQLTENFSFSELENNYSLFKNLSKLNVTIITNSSDKIELLYLLKTYQLL